MEVLEIAIGDTVYVDNIGSAEVLTFNDEEVLVIVDGEHRPRWFKRELITVIEGNEYD